MFITKGFFSIFEAGHSLRNRDFVEISDLSGRHNGAVFLVPLRDR